MTIRCSEQLVVQFITFFFLIHLVTKNRGRVSSRHNLLLLELTHFVFTKLLCSGELGAHLAQFLVYDVHRSQELTNVEEALGIILTIIPEGAVPAHQLDGMSILTHIYVEVGNLKFGLLIKLLQLGHHVLIFLALPHDKVGYECRHGAIDKVNDLLAVKVSLIRQLLEASLNVLQSIIKLSHLQEELVVLRE